MSAVTVKIEHEIPAGRVEDLLCSAFEHGIGYWARVADVEWVDGAQYSHQLPVRGGSVTLEDGDGSGWPKTARDYADVSLERGLTYVERELDVRPKLDQETIRRGLQLMATKHSRHWAEFLAENDDAETGDVFVQLCVFGEVIFG